MCLCVCYMYVGAYSAHKMASDHLDLELQEDLSHLL